MFSSSKMIKQRNLLQNKEKEEMRARDLINTDINKMSELEFRTTIIRTLAEVENSIENIRKSPSSEIKEIKFHQAKI